MIRIYKLLQPVNNKNENNDNNDNNIHIRESDTKSVNNRIEFEDSLSNNRNAKIYDNN